MKHLQTFESTPKWSSSHRKPKYSLFKIDHYHAEENLIEEFVSEIQAKLRLFDEFRNFIEKEWQGDAKNYFDEWDNSLGILSIPSWREFLDGSHNPGETTFFITYPDGEHLDEYEVLCELYKANPTKFEALILW